MYLQFRKKILQKHLLTNIFGLPIVFLPRNCLLRNCGTFQSLYAIFRVRKLISVWYIQLTLPFIAFGKHIVIINGKTSFRFL